MAVIRLGGHGDRVRQIQTLLAEQGIYRGPVDGQFGGGTLSAVAAFQRQAGLEPDGVVGEDTWQALTGAPPADAERTPTSLVERCLGLTGAFETGKAPPECYCGISGDFDGQGISFGVLQWNFGQGSLQLLIKDMLEAHEPVVRGVFGNYFDVLSQVIESDKDRLLAFARSVQDPVQHFVYEPWRGFAKALGRTPEFQSVQVRHAQSNFDRALSLCKDYGLVSERAAALMFDIVTQNGSISADTRAMIRADAKGLGSTLPEDKREVRIMEIVANRRANAANPRWRDDVRARKLCIARGSGTVHGIHYDLGEQFGIGLSPFA